MAVDYAQLEKQNGLPIGLLSAVTNAEDASGDNNAVSDAGAIGKFQFEPATAKEYGIDPTDPDQAATGAAKFLGNLYAKYKGDLPSTLAGYNWGQGNVDKKGLDNAPKETRDYIQKVTKALPQQFAQADTGNMTDATDYSKMSDEDLQKRLTQLEGEKSKTDYSKTDYSKMSDEELEAKLAQLKKTPLPQPEKDSFLASVRRYETENLKAAGQDLAGVVKPFKKDTSPGPAWLQAIGQYPGGVISGIGGALTSPFTSAVQGGVEEVAKGAYELAIPKEDRGNLSQEELQKAHQQAGVIGGAGAGMLGALGGAEFPNASAAVAKSPVTAAKALAPTAKELLASESGADAPIAAIKAGAGKIADKAFSPTPISPELAQIVKIADDIGITIPNAALLGKEGFAARHTNIKGLNEYETQVNKNFADLIGANDSGGKYTVVNEKALNDAKENNVAAMKQIDKEIGNVPLTKIMPQISADVQPLVTQSLPSDAAFWKARATDFNSKLLPDGSMSASDIRELTGYNSDLAKRARGTSNDAFIAQQTIKKLKSAVAEHATKEQQAKLFDVNNKYKLMTASTEGKKRGVSEKFYPETIRDIINKSYDDPNEVPYAARNLQTVLNTLHPTESSAIRGVTETKGGHATFTPRDELVAGHVFGHPAVGGSASILSKLNPVDWVTSKVVNSPQFRSKMLQAVEGTPMEEVITSQSPMLALPSPTEKPLIVDRIGRARPMTNEEINASLEKARMLAPDYRQQFADSLNTYKQTHKEGLKEGDLWREIVRGNAKLADINHPSNYLYDLTHKSDNRIATMKDIETIVANYQNEGVPMKDIQEAFARALKK